MGLGNLSNCNKLFIGLLRYYLHTGNGKALEAAKTTSRIHLFSILLRQKAMDVVLVG